MTEPHLTPTMSDRGFVALPSIPGDYGGHAQTWESSSAEGPKLWLDVVEPNDLNAWATGDESGGTHRSTLHLTAENAWRLADQLRHLVTTHYHGDATPDWARGSDLDA